MTDPDRCRVDDWVEVERVLLEPSERATGLPDDTAAQPLLLWVKGFALGEAALGEELIVETMTGRSITGRLSAILPGYFHTFGQPIPELVHVGRDLRAQLAGAGGAATGATGRAAADPSPAPEAGPR